MNPSDKVDLLLFNNYVECRSCGAKFKPEPKDMVYIETRLGVMARRIECPACDNVFHEVA